MRGPDGLLRIEIVCLLPTIFGHCTHCDFLVKCVKIDLKRAELEEYPTSLVEENHRISETVCNILEDFPGKVHVEVISTTSLTGIWKSLRYRLKPNIAFILNGRRIQEDVPDYPKLKAILEAELERQRKN